jgi:hypothetical protein
LAQVGARPADSSGVDDSRRRAYLAAYDLLEAVQSEDHAAALARLPAAMEVAEQAQWSEVEFVLAAAEVVHQVTRHSGAPLRVEALDALLQRAEDLDLRAFTAMALGLRALVASAIGDTARLLSDATRAIALLDDEHQPPLDRCTAYVVTAASLNTLRLWELVDELYTRAAELGPLCDAPAQAAAVATNRVLTRLEWALALSAMSCHLPSTSCCRGCGGTTSGRPRRWCACSAARTRPAARSRWPECDRR